VYIYIMFQNNGVGIAAKITKPKPVNLN